MEDETDDFLDYWFRAACEMVAKERAQMLKQSQMMNVQSFGTVPLEQEVANLNFLYDRLAAKDMKFLERNLLRGE